MMSKIIRDINSAKMHFWSKFKNPNFNWWWVIGMDKLKMGVNICFQVQFDLEGQGQPSHKTIGILTNEFHTSDPTRVTPLLAQRCETPWLRSLLFFEGFIPISH